MFGPLQVQFEVKTNFKLNSEEIMNNTEKVKVIAFNTLTNRYEEVYVTPEIAQAYKRTAWGIENNDKSFYDHEIQMSGLIGGKDNAYENFREFVSRSNDMQEEVEEQLLIEELHSALKELGETDCKIIYDLFHDCLSERECAKKFGVSQPMIHKKKERILKIIKKILK
jgi:DNA-directed RNA polymerase specialized sigma subunit